ncbi:hypothetical protein D3C75_765550 [compost metagenome]
MGKRHPRLLFEQIGEITGTQVYLPRTVGDRQVPVQIPMDVGNCPVHQYTCVTGLAYLHIRAALAAEFPDLSAELLEGSRAVHISQLLFQCYNLRIGRLL